jgi:hypothetical protein
MTTNPMEEVMASASLEMLRRLAEREEEEARKNRRDGDTINFAGSTGSAVPVTSNHMKTLDNTAMSAGTRLQVGPVPPVPASSELTPLEPVEPVGGDNRFHLHTTKEKEFQQLSVSGTGEPVEPAKNNVGWGRAELEPHSSSPWTGLSDRSVDQLAREIIELDLDPTAELPSQRSWTALRPCAG